MHIKKPSVNSITSSMVSAIGFSPRLQVRLPHSVSPAFLQQTTIITWLYYIISCYSSLLVTRLYCYKTKTASITDVVDNVAFVPFSSSCKNTLIFCEIQAEKKRIFAFIGWNRRPVNPEKKKLKEKNLLLLQRLREVQAMSLNEG